MTFILKCIDDEELIYEVSKHLYIVFICTEIY